MSRLTYRDEHGTAKLFQETLRRNPHAFAEKLAHYEDLEEAGRLIELPCATSDEEEFQTVITMVSKDDSKAFIVFDATKTTFEATEDFIRKIFELPAREAKLAELKGE